jgi:hypothetical protein
MTIVIPTWLLTLVGGAAAVVLIGSAIIGLLFILTFSNTKWY